MRFVMSIGLLCVVLGGCGSDTAPTTKMIDGPWSQDFSTSGNFLVMQLTSAGTRVSGTGNSVEGMFS